MSILLEEAGWELSKNFSHYQLDIPDQIAILSEDPEEIENIISDLIALNHYKFEDSVLKILPLAPSRLEFEDRTIDLGNFETVISCARDIRFFQELYGPLHPGLKLKLKSKIWFVNKNLYILKYKE